MERTSSFKKVPLKTPRVLDPIKTSPFVVPTTTRKEAPTGNGHMGAIPLKAVTNRFPQVGETEIQRLQGSFSAPLKLTRAWKPLLPMTPFKPPSVHQYEVASVLSEETGSQTNVQTTCYTLSPVVTFFHSSQDQI